MLPKYWRNNIEVLDVAGTVGVGTFLMSAEWEHLRIDMSNAHVHTTGCFHYKRCLDNGKTGWYCLETRGYDQLIEPDFLCRVHQGKGGDCRLVRPITKETYWDVFRCLRAENDKKALECMKRVSSLIGVGVSEMRRKYIDRKQPYKRNRESKQAPSIRLPKRSWLKKVAELDGYIEMGGWWI